MKGKGKKRRRRSTGVRESNGGGRATSVLSQRSARITPLSTQNELLLSQNGKEYNKEYNVRVRGSHTDHGCPAP